MAEDELIFEDEYTDEDTRSLWCDSAFAVTLIHNLPLHYRLRYFSWRFVFLASAPLSVVAGFYWHWWVTPNATYFSLLRILSAARNTSARDLRQQLRLIS